MPKLADDMRSELELVICVELIVTDTAVSVTKHTLLNRQLAVSHLL